MSEPGLRRALGVFEVAGLSVAMMAPTAAMALNGALAATYAGAAVPLAFVLAFAIVGCVAFAFVTFARVYASPASVGEFNARGLSPFVGRLSGWMLLLVYIMFTAGSAAECGAFAAAAFGYASVVVSWIPFGIACLLIAAYVGTRPARTSSRVMLVLEGVSVVAIVLLSFWILQRGGAHGISIDPLLGFTFSPAPQTHALFGVSIQPLTTLSGIGLATIFSLLSFAGFEGAAVLGAESHEPTRTIPRAIVGGVILAGVLYVFVAFAQTIGFGTDAKGIAAFAASSSPLGDLALRFTNVPIAALISLGAAISGFAGALAAATAAARLFLTLAATNHAPRVLARIEAASGTPVSAYLFTIALGLAIMLGFAVAHVSGTDTFAACGTIAVLALLLVYGSVQIAALRLFGPKWSFVERAVPIVALILLAITFVANVFPIPAGPAALYPYLVIVWLGIGALIVRERTQARSS